MPRNQERAIHREWQRQSVRWVAHVSQFPQALVHEILLAPQSNYGKSSGHRLPPPPDMLNGLASH